MNEFLLYKYFKGETTPEEEQQILDYAEFSEENMNTVLQARKIWDAYTFHGEPQPEQYVIKESNNNGMQSRRLLKTIGKIAAVICIGLLSTLLILTRMQDNISYATVEVPAGQRVKLTLSDGTTVWLNANSIFTYPTNFGRSDRSVELEGEAFFDVTEDQRKPFIVQTDQFDIRVLGTRFNVQADKRENVFKALLLEGSVEILSGDKDKRKAALTMVPGESVAWVNNKLEKAASSDLNITLWKDGILYFEDDSFNDMMEKLQDFYGVKITVENPKLNEYRCTGKFRADEGWEHILRVVRKDLKFDYSYHEEGKHIIIK